MKPSRLLGFAESTPPAPLALAADGGDCEEVIRKFTKSGVEVDVLTRQLQDEGAKSFVKSGNDLMTVINSKSSALKQAT